MMRYIFLSLFLFFSALACAQEKYFYLGLDINKPTSNTEWIESISAAGGKVGYRGFIRPNFSAGLDLGWSNFDEYEPTSTKVNPTGAITTDYFHYVYSYSGVVSGQYYFKDEEEDRFFPYAGLGLGANTNEYVLYYNIYEDAERSWGFLARPEVGLLFRFTERGSVGIMAALHYDYSTNKSEKFNYNNFTGLGFQIGLMAMTF
ncbi:MAG: outer membrane beta-barrel protein [Chryseosolibacter sp.]